MNEMIPFAYGEQPVRVVEIDGEPWFVAVDIAAVLDLGNIHSSIALLDDDERGLHTMETPSGTQQVVVISEPGLYSLILRSRKPQATPFRRWITHEVIPTVRKHGMYATADALDRMLADPTTMIRTLEALRDERAARVEAEQRAAELDVTASEQRARLRLVEPKAAAFDRWMGSGAEYSIDVAAKALSAAGYLTGRNRLFTELHELGWAYRDASGWHPYQQHGPEGTKRLAVRVFYFDDPGTGEARGKATLKITAKGIADMARLHGILPDDIRQAVEHSEDAA